MKTINTTLLQSLGEQSGTFAHCMLITRKDGIEIGFTDHSEEFTIAGTVYSPAQETDPSEVQSNSRAGVDNMEISGYLKDDGLSKADILLGLYNDARIDVFLVDYLNLPAAAEPGDAVWIKTFLMGNSRIEDDQFFIECRSLSDYLNKQIVELTSPNCRAKFGDARCKKDLTALTFSATIAGIVDKKRFTVTGSHTNDIFRYGHATFLTGANAGYTGDIVGNNGSTISFYDKPPLPVQIGDAVTLVAGCDKTFNTCINFENALNFQGEPHVPGIDKWKAGFQEVK